VVEVISMLENQVVYHVVRPPVEKLEILLLGELEEGNDHGTNQIWIISEKQTEKRTKKSRGTKKGISIPRKNLGGPSKTFCRGITPATHLTFS
jgi:hypothetical protein